MRFTMLLAALLFAGMLMVQAQDMSSPTPPSASPDASTLTGCVKVVKGSYYLVEDNGTRHILIAKGQDLSSYADHQVTVTGKSDTSRNAGTASDAHGNRSGMFSVDSVNDQGACKK